MAVRDTIEIIAQSLDVGLDVGLMSFGRTQDGVHSGTTRLSLKTQWGGPTTSGNGDFHWRLGVPLGS